MNKQDLRYIKTEKLITECYIELQRKSKGSVKIVDLCKMAMINKTTFYAHYECMEDLHKHICRRTIEELLENCPHISEIFTNTEAFVYSITKCFSENDTKLEILFKHDTDYMVNLVEESILKYYHLIGESSVEKTKLRFGIGGATRTIVSNSSDEELKITIELIKKIIN